MAAAFEGDGSSDIALASAAGTAPVSAAPFVLAMHFTWTNDAQDDLLQALGLLVSSAECLGLDDVFDLTDGTDAFIPNGAAQLQVTGDAGDRVTSTGQGWIDQGSVDIGGVSFASFANQELTAQLLVESDVSALIS